MSIHRLIVVSKIAIIVPLREQRRVKQFHVNGQSAADLHSGLITVPVHRLDNHRFMTVGHMIRFNFDRSDRSGCIA